MTGDQHVGMVDLGRHAGSPSTGRPGGRAARRGAGPGGDRTTGRSHPGGRRRRASRRRRPSMRRSSPHTFSTSSASWRPSTRMRLARATRAGGSRDRHRARGGAAGRRGAPGRRRDQRHLPAIDREPAVAQAHLPVASVGVAEGDDALGQRDDDAAQPAAPLLDRQPGDGLDLGVVGPAAVAVEVDRSAEDPLGVEAAGRLVVTHRVAERTDAPAGTVGPASGFRRR